MPKPDLLPEIAVLEREIISTMQAGLHQWRPDLDYPASHSDMQACVRALLVMFTVEIRPLPEPLPSPCTACEGTGYFILSETDRKVCPRCQHGKVYL